MTDTFRAMCEEFVKLCAPVDSIPQLTERLQKLNELADRARTLLAQPVAEGPTDEGPTDEEIISQADKFLAYSDAHMGDPARWEGSDVDLVAFTRHALSRWSRPTPQPVAVSERLPGPEDCDAEGRCWLGGHQMGRGTPTWLLGYPAWAERFPDVHRFWLPAHSLPTPEATND